MFSLATKSSGFKQIKFVGSSSAQVLTGNLTINVPTGTSSGKLMIAFIVSEDTGKNINAPTGWTVFSDNTNGRAIQYKIASDSETSYTWNTNSEDFNSQGFILTYSNALADVVGTFSSNSTPTVAPSITVTNNNSLALAWFNRQASGSITFTTPTGWTALVSESDANAPSSAIFYKNVDAGATGTVTSTPSSNTARGILASFKLN